FRRPVTSPASPSLPRLSVLPRPPPTSTLFPYTTLFRSFPEGFHNEVQVICTVVSTSKKTDPDIASMIGTSAALAISGIPFQGPIDRKSTRLNSSHVKTSYAVFCLKKKTRTPAEEPRGRP